MAAETSPCSIAASCVINVGRVNSRCVTALTFHSDRRVGAGTSGDYRALLLRLSAVGGSSDRRGPVRGGLDGDLLDSLTHQMIGEFGDRADGGRRPGCVKHRWRSGAIVRLIIHYYHR